MLKLQQVRVITYTERVVHHLILIYLLHMHIMLHDFRPTNVLRYEGGAWYSMLCSNGLHIKGNQREKYSYISISKRVT